MIKLHSVNENEFVFLDTQTKEVTILSTIDELCLFMDEYADGLRPSTLLEILDNIKDEGIYQKVFQRSSAPIAWKAKEFPKKRIFSFLEENIKLLNAELLGALVEQLKDSEIINFYHKTKEVLPTHLHTYIISGLSSDKAILKFIEQNKESLQTSLIEDTITYLNNDKLKIKFISQHPEILNISAQINILLSVNNDKYIVDFLHQHLSDLDTKNKIELITALNKDTEKVKFIEENEAYLDINQTIWIIQNISDDKIKWNYLQENKDSLSLQHQIVIVESIYDVNLKLEYISSNLSSLFNNQLCSIINSFEVQSQKLLEFLIQNNKSLDIAVKEEIVSKFDSSTLLKFYKKNQDKLEFDLQVAIIKQLNDENTIIDFLNKHDINDSDKENILLGLPTKKLLEIYDTNQFDSQNIIPVTILLRRIDKKEYTNFIINHLEKFSAETISGLTVKTLFLDKKILNILENNIQRLNIEQSLYLIFNSPPEKQEELFNNLSTQIHPTHQYILLSALKQKENGIVDIDEKMSELNIPNSMRNIYDKILNNFGFIFAINESLLPLLSESGITFFNEETVYQLVKYCVNAKTIPDISKATKNYELFEKFQIFRKANISQDLLDVINIQNTLIEFNQYFDLISSCLNGEMTEQEQSMLISILNDKNIEITSKEDLLNYPAKRSEYIDKLVSKNIDEAIVYLLTGLTCDEYSANEFLYFRDDQLEETLNDFSEELQTQISLMQISKELISLIQRESKETILETIQILKNSLEQEFTLEGSIISDLRNGFATFATQLRTLYGQELQESLATSKLPTPEKVDDVDVINLNGEDFKILIHGLNAYGTGKSTNYEHREIGKSYICTSLISQDCLFRASAEIYYGFKNISRRSLALEAPDDIYSTAKANSLEITSHRKPTFLKTDELIRRTEHAKHGPHNEIVLYRDQTDENGKVTPIMPDYIISFGDISEHDKSEARRLNIPIIVINEEIYTKMIEEKKQQRATASTTDVKTEARNEVTVEFSELREIMLNILKQAKNNCTAIQQEAIMAEMKKEFKKIQEQSKETTEVHSA